MDMLAFSLTQGWSVSWLGIKSSCASYSIHDTGCRSSTTSSMDGIGDLQTQLRSSPPRARSSHDSTWVGWRGEQQACFWQKIDHYHIFKNFSKDGSLVTQIHSKILAEWCDSLFSMHMIFFKIFTNNLGKWRWETSQQFPCPSPC
jgi:hypothetical protein